MADDPGPARRGEHDPWVRPTRAEDLQAIAALTAERRRRLAAWEPEFWAPADGSDELHRAWLARLVASADIVTRVVDDGGAAVGFAVSLPGGTAGPWTMYASKTAGGRTSAGASPARSSNVPPSPACSHYRLLRLPGRVLASPSDVTPARPERLVQGAPCTFLVDPQDPGAIVLADRDGGHIVGSPSTPAPGIYAPGGPACVVDRISGARRDRLVAALSAAAAARGDVQVLVACRADDDELPAMLDDDGWRQPVDLFAAPS